MKQVVDKWTDIRIMFFVNSLMLTLKEPQTISIYWFYLLHNYVLMSTKSK